MDDTPWGPAPGSHVRPWVVWTLVAAVTTASVGATLLALNMAEETTPIPQAAASDNEPVPSNPPASSPTDPPAPTPAPDSGDISPTVAEHALNNFLSAAGRAASAPENGLDGLTAVASGPILEELANEQAELASNGWSRVGTATVASLTITDSHPVADPPTITVSACIDSSTVNILDLSGDPIATQASGQRRSVNIYFLTLTDDTWLITGRTFPDEADC